MHRMYLHVGNVTLRMYCHHTPDTVRKEGSNNYTIELYPEFRLWMLSNLDCVYTHLDARNQPFFFQSMIRTLTTETRSIVVVPSSVWQGPSMPSVGIALPRLAESSVARTALLSSSLRRCGCRLFLSPRHNRWGELGHEYCISARMMCRSTCLHRSAGVPLFSLLALLFGSGDASLASSFSPALPSRFVLSMTWPSDVDYVVWNSRDAIHVWLFFWNATPVLLSRTNLVLPPASREVPGCDVHRRSINHCMFDALTTVVYDWDMRRRAMLLQRIHSVLFIVASCDATLE